MQPDMHLQHHLQVCMELTEGVQQLLAMSWAAGAEGLPLHVQQRASIHSEGHGAELIRKCLVMHQATCRSHLEAQRYLIIGFGLLCLFCLNGRGWTAGPGVLEASSQDGGEPHPEKQEPANSFTLLFSLMQSLKGDKVGQYTAGPCRATTYHPGRQQLPNVHNAVLDSKLPMTRLNSSHVSIMYTGTFENAHPVHSRAGFKIIYHDEAGRSEATRPFAANLCG